MPVSSGLQKYFDSQQKKKSKGDIKKKFQNLKGSVDPAFIASFEAFHDRILDIVEENPGVEEMIGEEIQELDMKMKNSQRKHDIKKAASIIRAVENV